jgi:alkylation response protein AidB-like acyl-CoA dehydrogenase
MPGFMGMTIPRELGGGGRSFLDAVLVVEEVAKACTVSARIVVEANMGAISTVMAYGTEAQRRLAAGLVLGGDKPAICITEPEAGSDAAAMRTRADRRRDGAFVLNGRKHWITGAGVSRLHLIFARAFDEDGRDLGIGGSSRCAARGRPASAWSGASPPWGCAGCRRANSPSRSWRCRRTWCWCRPPASGAASATC